METNIPKEILDLVKWENYPPSNCPSGGQTVGTMPTGRKLICSEAGFEIGINNYRSQIKNMDLCLMLFELYLMEIKVI
jgi:hypothetical protein